MTVMYIAPGATAGEAEAERRRAAVVALTAAADFIETHPDLPLGGFGSPLRVSVIGGSDEQNRAEVDRIAKILGVTPEGDAHYSAVLHFGGGVTYEAIAIRRREMDDYNAHMDGWHRKTAAA
jgi:hypothetical protein